MNGQTEATGKKRALNGAHSSDSLKKWRPSMSEAGLTRALKDSPLPHEFQDLFLKVVLQHGLQTASPKLLVNFLRFLADDELSLRRLS